LKDLQPFFNPKSVLIVGVSRQALSFSFTVLKNLLEIFYKGKLYILNPNANDILGVKSYHSFDELPEIPELAVIVLGKNILEVVENLGKIGVKYVAIQTELKPGAEINDLTFKLHQMCIKYGITYLGPSMLGIINFSDNFTTSIIPVRQHIMRGNKNVKEGICFIAQSGGLAGAMGWWTPSQKLPISKVIHLGKGFHINEADVLEYFLHDDTTKVISLFLREISNELIEAVKKVSLIKPILFYYVGKEEDQEEKLKDAGGILVLNYIELFDLAKIFLWCPEPKGVNLGIIGPSSGAIHLIIKENFGNPVDYWPPEKFVGIKICGIYNTASEALLRDSAVDGLILALEFFTEIEFDFNIYSSILETYPDKPVITILIQAEKEGAKRVIKSATELKIPVFENEIERAVRGYKLLYDYYSKIKKRN